MATKSADTLLNEAEKAATPTKVLDKVAAAREAHAATDARLRTATHTAIVDAREDGMSWPAIGQTLGVSAQRAQQLARPLDGDE